MMGKKCRYVVGDIDVAFDKTGNDVIFYVKNNEGTKIKDIMSERIMVLEGTEDKNVVDAIATNYPSMDRESISIASAPDLMTGVFLQEKDFIKGAAFFELSAKLVTRVPENDHKSVQSFISSWSKHYRVTAKQMKPFHDQLSKSLQNVYAGHQETKNSIDGRDF